MQTVIPQVLYEIITLIAELIRLIGMALVGVGIGYLAVDVLHKAEGWPMKAVGFLGLAGLVIAMAAFLTSGALGAFGIGLGVAVFVWGMPKKKKEEQE
jgi:NhaP-type Na+/H+ or K+/H+ antiporter